MRVEFALIVGIVFFCCWCAYIIVRMNSSVPQPPQPASVDLNQHQLKLNGHQNNLMMGDLAAATNYANSNYLYRQPPSGFQNSSNSSNTLVPMMNTAANLRAPVTASPYYLSNASAPPYYAQSGQLRRPPYSPVQKSSVGWPASQQHVAAASQSWRDYSSVRPATPQANAWRVHPSLAAPSLAPAPRSAYFAPSPQLAQAPFRLAPQHFSAASADNRWRPATAFHAPPQKQPTARVSVAAPEAAEGEEEPPSLQQAAPSNLELDPDPDADLTRSDQGDEAAGAEESSTQAPSAAEDESGEPEGDKLNRELEEQAARRSYSEDQADASERDRNGDLIVTHRKHLINGKPVKGTAASGSTKGASRSLRDFDRISGEIDDDTNQANDYYDGEAADAASSAVDGAKQQQQPQESRQRERRLAHGGASSGLVNLSGLLIGAPADKKGFTKRLLLNAAQPQASAKEIQLRGPKTKKAGDKGAPKERESHEHRLKESLSAQQWDDDSASSPEAKAKQEREEQRQAADQNQEESDAASVEEPSEGQEEPEASETGPQQVEEELKELDMTVDPERFMQSERRRRRKRQVNDNQVGVALVEPLEFNSLKASNESRVDESQVAENNATKMLLGEQSEKDDKKRLADNNEFEAGQEDINVEIVSEPEQFVRQPAPPLNSDFHSGGAQMHQPVATGFAQQSDLSAPPPDHQAYQSLYGANLNHLLHQEPGPPLEAGDIAQPMSNGHASPQHEAEYLQQQPGQVTGQEEQGAGEPGAELAEPQGVQISSNAGGQRGSESSFALNYPLEASSSKAKKKKVKKKFNRSKLTEAKYKAAKSIALKKKSKSRKGGGNKKKKKAKKKYGKTYKEFSGKKEGKKKAKGNGQQGGNKGALYYKDKGYKKHGFKKNYQKVETGDYKKYFDEFRDKDHNKKWKNFKDKHNYSQSKHWTGKDKKKFKNMHLNELKNKKYGTWRNKDASKYKKASKSGADSSYSKKKKYKKKKKSEFD